MTYDFEGNVQKSSLGANAETWTYQYDHNNRLTRAERRFTDGGLLWGRADYTYDYYGKLLTRTWTDGVTTVATRYAYDAGGLYLEMDSLNNVLVRYLRGDNGEVLAHIDSTGVVWLLHDQLGSVREVVQYSGFTPTSWKISYNGFGGILSEQDATKTGNILFAGMVYDRFLNLYRTWARDYNPWIGQWLQEDPIGLRGGSANFRGYVGNDPLNATDPLGLFAFLPFLIPAAKAAAVYLGIAGVTAAVGTTAEYGVAKATGEKDFSWQRSFVRNFAVDALTNGIPGATPGRYSVKLAALWAGRTAAETAYDVGVQKKSLRQSLLSNAVGNAAGVAAIPALRGLAWGGGRAWNVVGRRETWGRLWADDLGTVGTPAGVRAARAEAAKINRKFQGPIHHLASDKDKVFTPQFQALFDKAGFESTIGVESNAL